MSTKTNFKRVALVAVASLGLGVLTSVAPANAAATGLTVVATAGSTGYCLAGTPTAAATPRYMPVGGSQAFTVAGTPTAAATISITGNAKFVASPGNAGASTHTITGTDSKTLTLAATADEEALVTFTGTGPVSVTVDDTTDYTLYFIVQASCAPGWSASTSYAQLNTSDTSVTSNVDVAGGATVQYSTTGVQSSYLNIDLNDAYGNDAAISTSALIATVTGGCTLSFTSSATSGTTTAVSTGTGADTDSLVILNDNTPRSCVTTLTLDGTVVATKTSKFLGDVATLTIDADSTHIFAYGEAGSASATALNANGVIYYAKDSAGNVINLASVPTISGGTAGFQQVSFADGTYGYASGTTNGFATLDVNAASVTVRGPGTYKLKAVRQSDGVAVYSAEEKASINKSRYTYSASFDKASYVSGEIMTLTITAKDSAGNDAYDGETIGTNTIAVGGATQLSTIATTDTFLNGKKTYKFAAGATASGYGWSVDISSGSSQAAVVGTVQITAPAGGVSNADVLKAIVSLIASINKQIAALQKALLKK